MCFWYGTFTGMLRMSMTIGAMATTRESPVAAVIHVVHPRLDTPFTTKRPLRQGNDLRAANSSMAFMALTTLLVMGKMSGQVWSPVS